MRTTLILLIAALLSACSGTKKQAELLEQTKPSWLKERPVNPNYYYGIGITPKIGSPMLYEDKAKERALADISSQINSTIKAEAVFYQVEDKQGVHEYLQNRIKSTSSEYLEGYEYVDEWEDLSNVYIFYRLSKQKYQEIKEQRKRKALKLASEKYLTGLELIEKGSHMPAIEHFAQSIDALSGYLNESTTTEVEGEQVDLASESSTEMSDIVNGFRLISDVSMLDTSNFFLVCDDKGRRVRNCPVRLEYSGGYLVNDHVKSDDRGRVEMPELPQGKATSSQTLTVEIDLVNLGRQITRNLYVRKVIEQQKAGSVVLVD
ncbi:MULTISPECIES: LPP20 family lipoprotein [unclassified Saccharicrinis]|uniref:LPP20 family lipoprotein n=1 Tax=unclassified Saccharicrinis TaxID=2646859 RepID=UPI003D3272F7